MPIYADKEAQNIQGYNQIQKVKAYGESAAEIRSHQGQHKRGQTCQKSQEHTGEAINKELPASFQPRHIF